MADEEQFSLCWNNFNSNLSAGFHESLCRGDLVDVTLAAEGQLVKAHRLVLSVCSPYFRKMFTQMPANQHAFGKFNSIFFFYKVHCRSLKPSANKFFLPSCNLRYSKTSQKFCNLVFKSESVSSNLVQSSEKRW